MENIKSPGCIKDNVDYLGQDAYERYRQPEQNHDDSEGSHMNYETIIPGLKKPIVNIHIDMDNLKTDK